MPPAITTRERLQRMIDKSPYRSLDELAAETGVSKARVSKLLEEMGYERHTVWAKEGVKFVQSKH
jgi:hypothetical protein